MGLMSAELLEVIRKGGHIIPVLDFTVGGTTYRYAATGVASTNLGMYKPFIVNWSSISNGVSLKGRALQHLSCTVDIIDYDKTFHTIAEGSAANKIRGATVTGRLISPELSDYSKYFTFFSGIIDNYGKTGIDIWTFQLTSNYKPLESELKIFPISQFDFPNVPAENKEAAGQIVLGTHDSTGTGIGGVVPMTMVDETNDWWLFSCSPTPNVDEVFSDGASQGAGNYSQSNKEINGRYYRIVTFTASAPTIDNEVTADGGGLTTDGWGSSSVEENPANQLRQVLCWYVYNEENDVRGDLDDIPSNAPVDEASFRDAAAFFDRNNVKGSRVLTGDMTGTEVIRDFCQSFNSFVYWNNEGKLSLGVLDWAFDDIYGNDDTILHIHHNQPGVGADLKYGYLTDILADEVSVDFFYDHSHSKFLRNVRVKHVDPAWGIKSSRSMKWSSADQ